MNDPYKTLGISPDATDDEIKKAYKELVKKYHPDQYQDNPLADVAAEKMSEVNAAYDAIMNSRRGGGHGLTGQNNTYSYGGGSSSSYSTAYNSNSIRMKIQSGNITAAEQDLNAVDSSERDAEWYFLMGSVCYKRGWLNDAYTHYQRAYQMNPSNQEYAQAINLMNRQRGGYMNGNPMGGNGTMQGAGGMDCCTQLCCADCCCEMMGGDLIPCC